MWKKRSLASIHSCLIREDSQDRWGSSRKKRGFYPWETIWPIYSGQYKNTLYKQFWTCEEINQVFLDDTKELAHCQHNFRRPTSFYRFTTMTFIQNSSFNTKLWLINPGQVRTLIKYHEYSQSEEHIFNFIN